MELNYTIQIWKEGNMYVSKENILQPIVIPRYKNVPVFIIEKNLKTAGLFREEYFKLLKRV